MRKAEIEEAIRRKLLELHPIDADDITIRSYERKAWMDESGEKLEQVFMAEFKGRLIPFVYRADMGSRFPERETVSWFNNGWYTYKELS